MKLNTMTNTTHIQFEELLEQLSYKLDQLKPFTDVEESRLESTNFEVLPDLIKECRFGFLDFEKVLKDFKESSTMSTSKRANIISDYEVKLNRLRSNFRTLVLRSKQSNDRYQQHLLLSQPTSSLRQRNSNKPNKKNALKTSYNITSSLQRSLETLETELTKSSTSYEEFTQSTKVLTETNQAYKLVDGTLKISKSLLGKLEWNQMLDYLILVCGFLIFISTVVYVITKRIGLPFMNPFSMTYYLIKTGYRLFVANPQQIPDNNEL